MKILLMFLSLIFVFTPVLPVSAQDDNTSMYIILTSDMPYMPEYLVETTDILGKRLEGVGVEEYSITTAVFGRDPYFFILMTPPSDSEDFLEVLDLLIAPGLLEFVNIGDATERTDWEGTCVFTDYQKELYMNLCENGSLLYNSIITNKHLEDAQATMLQTQQWGINFVLDEEGTSIFAEFASAHAGQVIVITLDGIIISAPIISDPIIGGQGFISGDFEEEEALALEAQLNSKPLPLVLTVVAVDTLGSAENTAP